MPGFIWSEGHICDLCEPEAMAIKITSPILLLLGFGCWYYNFSAAPLFYTDEGSLGKRVFWPILQRIFRQQSEQNSEDDGDAEDTGWECLIGIEEQFQEAIKFLQEKYNMIKSMIRCVISFVQVIAGLGGIRMEWPKDFKEIIKVFSIVQVSFELPSVAYARSQLIDYTFYHHLVLYTCGPLLLFAALALPFQKRQGSWSQ